MIDNTLSSIREKGERAFACEVNDTALVVPESGVSDAPSHVLLPTGVATGSVFVVGELVELVALGEGNGIYRGRLVNATGTVYVHAGHVQFSNASEYQDIELPACLAVLGAPRTTKTVEGTAFVSIHPDYMTRVDTRTWHRWLHETAARTLERIQVFNRVETEDAVFARKKYGDDVAKYRQAVSMVRDVFTEPGSDDSQE